MSIPSLKDQQPPLVRAYLNEHLRRAVRSPLWLPAVPHVDPEGELGEGLVVQRRDGSAGTRTVTDPNPTHGFTHC